VRMSKTESRTPNRFSSVLSAWLSSPTRRCILATRQSTCRPAGRPVRIPSAS
jgi:hypothetical protein